MKRALLSALCLLAMAVSCDRGPERIPRGEMEEIMQKILMQDQYIKQHLEVRRQADTMLVYEGIFEQYGYDTDDFLSSLEYYLEDPARMGGSEGAGAGKLEKELPAPVFPQSQYPFAAPAP